MGNAHEPDKRNDASMPREKDFSLDDIVREYGGWTEQPPVAEPTAQETEETPIAEQAHIAFEWLRPDEEEGPETENVSEAEDPPEPEHEPEEIPDEKPKLRLVEKKQKKRRRTLPEKTPQQMQSEIKKELRLLPLRAYLTGFLTVLAGILTLWQGMEWPIPVSLPSVSTLSIALLAIYVLCLLLSLDALLRGLQQILLLRFNLESSLLLCSVVVLLDGFAAFSSGRIPLYAPVCLSLFLANYGRSKRLKGNYRAIKVLLSEEPREYVYHLPKQWHNTDCLTHESSDIAIGAQCLNEPDGCERALRVYCPMVSIAALILSVTTSIVAKQNFLWVFAVMLTGSLPAMGFFCFSAPMQQLALRLQKSGAALLGWRGLRLLCGSKYLMLSSKDLFPKSSVAFNGLKVFGSYRVNQVVACAGTMMIAAGSELEPIFTDLMQEYGVREYPMGSFRRYEGGGYGAEIGGDVVLTGSLRFMRLMGIAIPNELNLKQALFLSINGELAGVFALTYKAAGTIRSALVSVQHSSGLTPLLATRDFLISPQFLAQKFKISSDSLEFPAVADRVRLSELELPRDATPAAVMTKQSMSAYAGSVLGARTLNSITRWSIVFCFLSGLMGLLIMLLLTRTGAVAIASAANLLLYMLLWLIPTILLDLWVRFI